MTVQELIDELQKIERKSSTICVKKGTTNHPYSYPEKVKEEAGLHIVMLYREPYTLE